ncbi:MAG: alkyl sulfatase dimerization domain-containing protein [Caldilineaceae bacterium]
MNTQQYNEATQSTTDVYNHLLATLHFGDRQDFADAEQGWLMSDAETIPMPPVSTWNLDDYRIMLDAYPDTAPGTVNPSLWRQFELVMKTGLFEVATFEVYGQSCGIYQIRNYDLANMTIIEALSTLIVVDTLTSKETAETALKLFYTWCDRIGKTKKAVKHIIYTHSHIDHYGGARGITDYDYVGEGLPQPAIEIYAPAGFLTHALEENVMAGNVMSRRAMYMYGAFLPANPHAHVSTGLGLKVPSKATNTLVKPTVIIGGPSAEGNPKGGGHFVERLIDGLDFTFQLVPDSEAPAEMHFYIAEANALCTAENAVHTLHNLYTLRGSKVRDAKAWSDYLQETIETWGHKAKVLAGVHHWPVWERGNQEIVNYLKKQHNVYKYIHDQTLRLANHGYNMDEIAEMIVQAGLPASLNTHWATRDYYGTLRHNVKAVYVYYLGWFDGNPATLNPYPRVAAAHKYVEYLTAGISTVDTLVAKAQQDYDAGHYRWVAQLLNHVIYANPDHVAAKQLQAAALEQLGYQAESGPWRNFYLSAALTLRGGQECASANGSVSPDAIAAMSTDMLFDYMAIRLDGFQTMARNQVFHFLWTFTNGNGVVTESYLMTLEDGVLNHEERANREKVTVDATLILMRETLNCVIRGPDVDQRLKRAIDAGCVTIAPNDAETENKVLALFGLFDDFDPLFNLVTPIIPDQRERSSC